MSERRFSRCTREIAFSCERGQIEFEDRFGRVSPVGQGSPEGSAQEFDERPETDEKAALSCVHAHLLEVHPHKRKQRAKGGVEEEVEGLDGEELLVDGAEEVLQDIALTANLVRGLLRLRIRGGVDDTLGLRIHHRPGGWHLRQSPARRLRVVRRTPIIVILMSIVLHDLSHSLTLARVARETLSRRWSVRNLPPGYLDAGPTSRYVAERGNPSRRYYVGFCRSGRPFDVPFTSLTPTRAPPIISTAEPVLSVLSCQIDVGPYGAAFLPKSINTLLRRRNFCPPPHSCHPHSTDAIPSCLNAISTWVIFSTNTISICPPISLSYNPSPLPPIFLR